MYNQYLRAAPRASVRLELPTNLHKIEPVNVLDHVLVSGELAIDSAGPDVLAQPRQLL
jgi:hypothetical protein